MGRDFWQGHGGTAGGPSSYDAWQQQHLGQLTRAIGEAGASTNTAPGAFGPAAGGPVIHAPLTRGEKKALLIISALVLAILSGVLIVNVIDDQTKARNRSARKAEQSELQRASDERWGPVLNQALRRYSPARDIAAIGAAARVSPCYRDAISRLVAGAQLSAAGCPRPMSFSAPFQASVASDRFSVEYVTADPTTRTRMNVMAIEPWALRAGQANGDKAPVEVAIDTLGAATVQRYVGRGCLAVDARRYATNLPPDTGTRQRAESDVRASYASLSAVTIACRAGDRLRVATSRTYRR